ncbi:MAG: hypothetical protein ACYSW2_08220 [Planctomycetota bacterium]|jgi:Ca2+-binding EF-hand superfamily protein
MDTTSINSHPSLVTARLAHMGRVPVKTRTESETPARIQAISERSLAAAKAAQAPATLDAAPPPPIADKGTDHSNQSLLEQLKADWGKTNSPWDLNDDGTVDIRDFLRLLAKLAGGNEDSVPFPPENGPSAKPAPLDLGEPIEKGADGKSPLEQLLADWGKADSPWDLNDDGTVDIRDFLKLLAQNGSGIDDPPIPTDQVGDETETITENVADDVGSSGNKTPLEQLLADWGKTDSPWDLNDDGTVDIRDFLKLLAQNGGGTNDTPNIPPHQLHVQGETIAENHKQQSPLQQLLADWGKTDSPWDLNGDGTVNIRDFLKLLAQNDGANNAPTFPPGPAPNLEPTAIDVGEVGEPSEPQSPIPR